MFAKRHTVWLKIAAKSLAVSSTLPGNLCQREVNGVLAAVGLLRDKPHSSLYYKALATTTTVTTKDVPIEETNDEAPADKKEEPAAEETKEEAKKQDAMQE